MRVEVQLEPIMCTSVCTCTYNNPSERKVISFTPRFLHVSTFNIGKSSHLTTQFRYPIRNILIMIYICGSTAGRASGWRHYKRTAARGSFLHGSLCMCLLHICTIQVITCIQGTDSLTGSLDRRILNVTYIPSHKRAEEGTGISLK